MRDRWASRTIFLFAAIGSAVGLGNVWRFPYLTYKFGGGAFLIPYLLALFVIGIPVLILEFALGQKLQKGAVGSFQKIHPKLKGVGVAAILASFLVVVYYTVILAWSLIYTIKSFASPLPWTGDSEGYFFNNILGLTSGPGVLGGIQWPIFFALLIMWASIYFIVRKGVKSVGKAVVITMPLPIILLIILFFRGITLPGAMLGIMAYLKPNFSTLLSPEIWTAAASQIFFTLSVGYGIMIAYASFNKPKQDITGDALITALTNSAISLFAGFVVFSIIGYMALSNGVGIDQAVASGPGLAFVVFPQALSLMPLSWLFAALFFIMLITLGIDSAFSLIEGVNTVIGDHYEKPNRPKIAFWTMLAAFVLGIIFTTGAGLYYLDIVDYFVTHYIILVTGITSTIGVGWIYGAKKLRTYINSVSKIKLGRWWDWAIKFIIPGILTILLILQVYTDITTPYGDYPQWSLAVGWAASLIPLVIALWFSISCKKKLN